MKYCFENFSKFYMTFLKLSNTKFSTHIFSRKYKRLGIGMRRAENVMRIEKAIWQS